jgi:hypothetical protein
MLVQTPQRTLTVARVLSNRHKCPFPSTGKQRGDRRAPSDQTLGSASRLWTLQYHAQSARLHGQRRLTRRYHIHRRRQSMNTHGSWISHADLVPAAVRMAGDWMIVCMQCNLKHEDGTWSGSESPDCRSFRRWIGPLVRPYDRGTRCVESETTGSSVLSISYLKVPQQTILRLDLPCASSFNTSCTPTMGTR